MARTATDYLTLAQDAFDAGFMSMAAQKRALDSLNRAYEVIRDAVHTEQIKAAPSFDEPDARRDHFAANDLPFSLHHVRDLHIEIIAAWGGNPVMVRDMIALRTAIKAAVIAAPPVNEDKVRVETVRRSIVEEMARRNAQYIEGLDMARLFGGLHVSVNAHWVYGHKGAIFLRRFFYLAGRLTPLNTIMAIADQLEREEGMAA